MVLSVRLRTLVAAAVLVLIVAGGYEPFYLQILTANRFALRLHYVELPYRKLPGLRNLMTAVAEATSPGDRIAVAIPSQPPEGYAYGFNRSAYLLAGRQLVPLVDRDGRPLDGNFAEADYLACWSCTMNAPGATMVLETKWGTLMRLR